MGESQLSDDDKAFIIRKAEDIPDPLSVALLPATIAYRGAAFLPLSGRIGMLPVYSNVPQINQSESGIDTLKQAVIRYLCLYPHAGMMLKLCVIDPPSVEVIVSMLKALNNDKEFNINGIEVSILHTKEVPASWIEIDDNSLNDGMLGKVKGKRSLRFRLRISHRKCTYNMAINDITQEQHLIIIFDPNEVKIETAQNNRQIHIHPLCVPKIYKYNPIDEKVEIRPASEGGIFTVYARINKVFRDYGINAYPVDPEMVQEASRFTRFSVELKSGETIRTLERYKTDIGIQLEANGEILIDHIRGTKYLSVDVPFADSGKPISLLEHLSLLDNTTGNLDVIAGQKPDSSFEIVDISKAPHMLIAGTTGSGKTIFLYSIIVSLLHKYPAEELEFLIIDPKQTDFVFFEDLPNLYGGHIVTDAEEALEMIQRINDVDKENRMKSIRASRSRDIVSYNEKNSDNRMKRLIIIIDEYADLIQTAEMQGNRKEFEKFLSMLAQKVRSLGIHLIIATQRPSANIVTGVLKANIPYRISFRLPSHTDSQTILDMSGAENLLGKGDMLMVTDSDTIRMQGLFISEKELDEFVSTL